MNIEKQILDDINNYDIVVYMKGTPDVPQCGFSGKVIHLLKQCGVDFNQSSDCKIKCIDVLKDPEIRQGIKDFSHWPTIPQVYIRGEFIGGSDIVGEMYQQGELQKLLDECVEIE